MDTQRTDSDPNLDLITREILSKVPAESIVLSGSRATGEGVSPGSDYDIIVVMGLFQVVFYLGRLRKIEQGLIKRVGRQITISPLSTFRARRANGNLYLFKVKREGVLLHGKDWLAAMEPGEIKDIKVDKYFSYLFSGMKLLIHEFDPGLVPAESGDERWNNISRAAAKAMLYCGEIASLTQGFYESRTEKMVSLLSEQASASIIPPGFVQDLDLASRVRREIDAPKDPWAFWLQVRGHLFETFGLLMSIFMGSRNSALDALVEQYLRKRRGFSAKNLQYTALAALGRKGFWWQAGLTRYQVEDRVRIGLLRLLSSIRPEGAIERRPLEMACRSLKGYMRVQDGGSDAELWRSVRDTVEAHWPYACVLMGL